ncbi:MAG: hypothetical protein ACP5II_05085 [Infirmifilum sp.]|uniref:Uncharacterized protein n=1 Tax=Infirmifilum uzonense TaxID=1550241 RepID=A0A0F7FHX5_9CREN|nr:hypothetical protein [Infirmifilum uzonense]AKG38893.1 hypothetical protein MA03_05990 [Infirmifilum uzonense]
MSNDALQGLREALDRLIERVSKRVEEEFSHDPSLQVTITAFLGEDWPYELLIEVEARSRVYNSDYIRRVLERILDEELGKAEEELKGIGLRVLS